MAPSQQNEEQLWTPANKVTFARIVLIPVFVVVLIAPWPQFFPSWMDMPTAKPWLAAAVFILLSLTDTLDGYLARSRGEVTDFGKFMDPLADKLLVTAALLGLIELDVIPSWVALIIIAREFIVSGARMVAASKGEVIAASWYGKVKTVFQMIAIVLFIIKDSHIIYSTNMLRSDWLYLLSWAVMVIALLMTIVSMFDYLYKAHHLFGFKKKDATSSVHEKRRDYPTKESLLASTEQLISKARDARVVVATAESCTGGLIAGTLTAIAGSSDVVAGGVVSYSNEVKEALLEVAPDDLARVGAVSEEVAQAMARGARKQIGADIAVSVTGIAGPGGGTAEKPVGTVWIGLAAGEKVWATRHQFSGNRSEVRRQTVEEALRELSRGIDELSRP